MKKHKHLSFLCRSGTKVSPRQRSLHHSPVKPSPAPCLDHRPVPEQPTPLGPFPVRPRPCVATGPQATATRSLWPTNRSLLRPPPSDPSPPTPQMDPCFSISLRLWPRPPFTPCTLSSTHWAGASSQEVRVHCPVVRPEVTPPVNHNATKHTHTHDPLKLKVKPGKAKAS